MLGLLQDVRFAIRKFQKTPGFTAIAVVSLGLGIGATTAIYTIFDRVILDPLPVRNPERLVTVYTAVEGGYEFSNPAYPDYIDYATATDALSGLAAYSGLDVALAAGGSSQRIHGQLVTGNYFDVLGVVPSLGRAIVPADDRPGAASSVMISHRLWKRRFGSDPDIVDRDIRLNGHPFTIVGVAPPRFRGVRLDETPDFWAPMQARPQLATGFFAQLDVFNDRDIRWLNTVGRLQPWATLESARAALDVVARRLAEAYPETNDDRSVSVAPATVAAALNGRADLVRFVTLLGAVVALALLIACANVANLLLARGAARRREMAIRSAIGAGRGRLLRQLLSESLLLSVIGAAAGIGFAALTLKLLSRFTLPGDIALATLGLGLSPKVLLFSVALAIGTALLFGALPALQASRPRLVPALKDGTAGGGYGRSRTRSSLVTVQVALSLVLLIGAGLFVRSLRQALAIDIGFEATRTLAGSLSLGEHGYDEPAARDFYDRLLERAEALPSVASAAIAMRVPVSSAGMRASIAIEGHESAADQDIQADINIVSPGYFRTMGIPLLAGRDIADHDVNGAAGVAVVNATLAERFWPDSDPVGKRLKFDGEDNPWMEVVGVVADSKYRRLQEETPLYLYLPLDQAFGFSGLRKNNLVIRTTDDPGALASPLRAEVAALDSDVLLFDVRRVEQQVAEMLLPQRMGMTLLSVLGVLALALASIGIYGVVAYVVARRTREIAIRAALGARPGQLTRLMLEGSMLAVISGVVLGVVAAAVAAQTLEAFLYGVSPTDPLTFAAVALALIAVALFASYLPARRAARLAPIIALREE